MEHLDTMAGFLVFFLVMRSVVLKLSELFPVSLS